MIPLSLPAQAEAELPFVTRLSCRRDDAVSPSDSILWEASNDGAAFVGAEGLFAIEGLPSEALDGDIVLVQPAAGRAERILRADSPHNTLLVTERCDQLCIMCSQPPKKTHHDRFDLFEQACLLAPPDQLIGISGGEPTLYKEPLLGMMERVLEARPDLRFHVLTNAQHFEADDIERLRDKRYRRVTWGVPLYASDPGLHDEIVGKEGAFARLQESLAYLLLAGARVELRTVLLSSNLQGLPALARFVAVRLRFIEVWSIMQLENIGFARNRWPQLYVDHRSQFTPIATAIDWAHMHGVPAQLFNFPRCTVPEGYRTLAAASISDWKRKYPAPCDGCRARSDCCGFFEWHPDRHAATSVSPL